MFTEGQKALLLKYLLGGLAVGGATNLTLNMLSYLNDKKKNVEYKDKLKSVSEKENPVVEIDPDELNSMLEMKKNASDDSSPLKPGLVSNTLASTLTWLAAGLGLVGGYKAMDVLHDSIKENELSDEEKAEAQDYYKKLYLLQQINNENPKYASIEKKAAASDLLGGMLGIMLLTSLGTALVSRSAFKKQFPMENSLKEKMEEFELQSDPTKNFILPKSIKFKEVSKNNKIKENVNLNSDEDSAEEIKAIPDNENTDKDDDFSKAINKFSFETFKNDCNEALLKVAYAMETKKGISKNISNLIKAASLGYTKELKDIAKSNADIFKFANDVSTVIHRSANDKLANQLAFTWIASDNDISSCIMPKVANEFRQDAPSLFKMAAYLPQGAENVMTPLLSASVIKERGETFKKIASDLSNVKVNFNEGFDSNEVASVIEPLLRSNLNSTKSNIRTNILNSLK